MGIDRSKQNKMGSSTARSSSSVSDSDPELALDLQQSPGVDLQVFHILASGKVVPCDDVDAALVDVRSSEQTNQASYWIHVDADERHREEWNEWIDRLNLGCYISGQIKRPAHEWLSNVMCTRLKALVMFRILPSSETSEKIEFDKDRYYRHLAAVVTTRMLLTFTTTSQRDIKSIHTTRASVRHMTQDEALHEGSSSAALLSVLEFHLRNTQDAITALRNKSLLMVKQMDLEPKKISLEDILNLRNSVLTILSVAEEQLHCLAMMKDMDKESDGADFGKIEGALAMLAKTAKSTELLAQRIERRVEGLKNAFGAHQQDRMNRRLEILTVVSVIFMPLTFMAGVYGMNFDNMPELHHEYGYFILWGTMLAVAVGLVIFFYKEGWFN